MPWTTEQNIFTVEAYFRQMSIHAAQLHFKAAHFLLSGHVNSKNNIFWGSTPPDHCLQRPLHSVKCTAWVAISKHAIIGPFWFEDDNKRSVTINTERYVQMLGKFWTALGRRRGVVRVLQLFQQDGATPTPQTNHWHGYSSVSLTDWSATGVTRSGHRIHRTWTPHIFICGDALRTGCMVTTPDYPWPEGSNHSSNKSDPKRCMREGHRELCSPDPNVPAAPGSSFGAHFLSASETKSFCSTDLKLWRYLLHRLDLMQLTFCVNLNKILEVIRFLVMTVFLCHPVKPLHTLKRMNSAC